jgi:hypothetical protein
MANNKNKANQNNFQDYSDYWKENSHKIAQNFQNFFDNTTKKMKKKSDYTKENFIKERHKTLENLSETNKALINALKNISQLQIKYVKETFEEIQSIAKNIAVDNKPLDLNVQKDKVQTMIKKNIDHAKKIGSIVMNSQKEIQGKIKDRVSEFSNNINKTTH